MFHKSLEIIVIQCESDTSKVKRILEISWPLFIVYNVIRGEVSNVFEFYEELLL